MLLHASPFEARAAFLYRNVCDFPEELGAGRLESADGEALAEGLRYLRRLLLDIYADTAAYRVEDALESYHRLTQTVLLLYMAGAHGELLREGEVSFLRVSKAAIRRHFKKPAAFHLDALQSYGFYFEYFKNGSLAGTYASCDAVCMYNESCASFFPALVYLCGRIPEMDSKKDYAMRTDLFLRADFNSILLGGGRRREDIDPLGPDMMNSLGLKAPLWEALVKALVQARGLKASCKFWSYCTPHWIVHLTRRGKAVCIFTLHTDILCFEMAAPYELLERMAKAKETLAPNLRRCLEALGCIRCGRCGGENIVPVNGVALCREEPWARRLYFEVASQAEAEGVVALTGA